jgi:hypothetical protein
MDQIMTEKIALTVDEILQKQQEVLGQFRKNFGEDVAMDDSITIAQIEEQQEQDHVLPSPE